MTEFNYDDTIQTINGFTTDISKIKEDFFDKLERSKSTIISQLKNNPDGLSETAINIIYQEASAKQDDLEMQRANIIDKINELTEYKIMLEYRNTYQTAASEGFENIAPETMTRDLVMLYNMQYLQMFCKILGIVIIIIIFWKYFSSITGTASLPSIFSQQAANVPAAPAPAPQPDIDASAK
jgi:hypothetical protein